MTMKWRPMWLTSERANTEVEPTWRLADEATRRRGGEAGHYSREKVQTERTALRWLATLAAWTMVIACGSSESPNDGAGGIIGQGGSSATGAAGTSATGGAAWTGGTTGTGGSEAGGTGNSSGDVFWTGTYNPNCTPAPVYGRDESQGHHSPGSDCMTPGCHLNPMPALHNAAMACTDCHSGGSPDGSGAPAFLFGGTVYQAGTTTGAANVEVGVKSGSTLAVACSAANGNFWVLAGPTITWSSANTRMRSSAGEVPMETAPSAGCNASGCHDSFGTLSAP